MQTLLDNKAVKKSFQSPTEVILEFYKSNIIRLSKKDKSILVQTFVYVLLSNLFISGQTIDVSQNSKITSVRVWSFICLNVKGMLLLDFEFCWPA